MVMVRRLNDVSAPLGAPDTAPKGAEIRLPTRRYKHLAPTVLVSAILTVTPDLQQHAAGDCQGLVLLFFA